MSMIKFFLEASGLLATVAAGQIVQRGRPARTAADTLNDPANERQGIAVLGAQPGIEPPDQGGLYPSNKPTLLMLK